MTAPSDLAFESALGQAARIAAGELSSVELVRLHLDRIACLDGDLGAFVTVDGDQALETARRADAAPPEARGRFHGVPVAVKDNADTAGLRTTYSSRAFRDHVPDRDTAVVERLRAAGLVILGKTNTPEFGMLPVTESELNGVCRNPWASDRTAGGSSGGSAAAVAAGLAPIGHGTDGAGSIRIPASCCGVVGLKPARGRVSWGPGFGEFMGPLATPAMLGRTVADVAAATVSIAGAQTGDPYPLRDDARFEDGLRCDPRRLRIAVTTDAPTGVEVDPICAAAARAAALLLEDCGHEVTEASPAWRDDQVLGHVGTVARTITAYYAGVDLALVEPMNRALAEAAAETSSLDYARAMIELQRFGRRVLALWDEYDVLVTPTLALPPVPVGWVLEEEDPIERFARIGRFSPFALPFNISGQPAISLPLHASDDGLPIGVQLCGPPAGEALLLQLAAQLERVRPWASERPPAA